MDYHSKKDPQKKAQKVADAFVDTSSWKTDPNGSYTGKTVSYTHLTLPTTCTV